MIFFSTFYNQVLNTMKSNTIAHMSDEDIINMLDMMLMRAIADFRFPDVELTFELRKNPATNQLENAFVENVTQREINVLLALVKQYWLEQQLDNENQFDSLYYDKDVKTYSAANLLKQINDRHERSIQESRMAQYNYSRGHGKNIRLGAINE